MPVAWHLCVCVSFGELNLLRNRTLNCLPTGAPSTISPLQQGFLIKFIYSEKPYHPPHVIHDTEALTRDTQLNDQLDGFIMVIKPALCYHVALEERRLSISTS